MRLADIDALFKRLDREIWLVTARDGRRRGGLIATFVGQAALAPEEPRVLLGVARYHHTWQLIDASRAFALHLLTEDQVELVWRFGLRSGQELDKLESCAMEEGQSGSPIVRDALGWLDCRVETSLDTGDRTVYLGQVLEGRLNGPEPPLTTRRLLQLASPEVRRQLEEQVKQDSARDVEAIHAWRRARGLEPTPPPP